MTPARNPGSVGVLSPEELESVLDVLPAALFAVTDDHSGRLARTGLLNAIGTKPSTQVALSELIDPAHMAAAIALLAQEVPPPVPTATRMRLLAPDAAFEVLATSRRVSLDDEADAWPLLALVPAPEKGDDAVELAHREELLAEAERVARLGSWDWDIVADVVTWSDELYRIYGHEPAAFNVTLQKVLDLTIPEDRDYTRAVIEHGLASQLPFTYAHRIHRPDGEVRLLHSRGRVTEVDESGHPTHVVGACQDVTTQHDLRELGRQYRDLYERERRVATRLREVDDMKDALVAAVSHDLRTPLAVIVGGATTLRDHGHRLASDARDALLDNVISNSTRLQSMLADLLDLDRIRHGALEPHLRPTALCELVERVLHDGGYDGDRVTLVGVEPDVIADIDAPKVERIVENLVRNALLHTPAGSPVTIRIEQHRAAAELVVEDSGHGVPEENRARIFEPFERGPVGAAAPSGTGLGLAIVFRFARLHGGDAWVDDSPTGGASFHVLLPLHTMG